VSVQPDDSIIPQEKAPAVTRALRETFGVSDYDAITRITVGNATSRVFRIVVKGVPFLLKMILRTDDATRHYACMKAGAAAGLAPHVLYASVEDKISITEFVQAVPFPATEALLRIPAVLRALHALPPFPQIPSQINTSCTFLLNQGPALDEFLRRFQAAGILPQTDCEELFARYTQIAEIYPHHAPDMVSSHNDLFKPDNILFDGDRVWLVDWEAAFLNDRYADLAVVANMLVASDADEELFLTCYFGHPPDEHQRARFFLMQQISHIFYALGFLFLGSAVQPVDWAEPVPGFRHFHQRFWAGEFDLKDARMKILYARVHLEQLLHNVRQPRFDKAVTEQMQRR
jgi:aminoglycoside phosphotransferase (APT) family kinase protein